MQVYRSVWVTCSLFALVGCSGSGKTTSQDTEGEGNTSGIELPGASGEEAGSGPRLDVGGGGGGASAGESAGSLGCNKIDFLFVIDNSGSMEDEQQNLVNSFPEFIDSIQNATNVSDSQIMVIDTDECSENIGVGQAGACNAGDDPQCCDSLCATYPGGSCNGAACSCPATDDPCDLALGGGKVDDKNGQPCGIDGDRRYMVAGQSDLDATFACVAEVGIKGSGDEQTMEALTAAVSESATSQGGCNEGFIRDDALLVVSIITDEEDDQEFQTGFGSDGEPGQWYQAVVSRKGGNPDNAVVLALVGPRPPEDCPALDKSGNAVDGAEVAERILQFTDMFPFGFVGPVCSTSYKSFFDQAVSVIDQACDEFEPQG